MKRAEIYVVRNGICTKGNVYIVVIRHYEIAETHLVNRVHFLRSTFHTLFENPSFIRMFQAQKYGRIIYFNIIFDYYIYYIISNAILHLFIRDWHILFAFSIFRVLTINFRALI